MRKLLVLCLFAFLTTSATHAQNWFSPEYRWVSNVSGGFAGFNFNFEMVFDSDTVIHGLASRKWVFNSQSSSYYTLTPRYTYSDGPKAYVYDSRLDSFVKIYDFTLPVGSQLQIPKEIGFFTYQIDSVDQVQAGDFYLKRQHAHYIDLDGFPGIWDFDILENIGMVGQPLEDEYPSCSFVLLPDYNCYSIADGIDVKFLCFSTPSGNFNPYDGTCSIVSTTNPQQNAFEVVPNPMSDHFDILLDQHSAPLQSVALIGIDGKRIRQCVNTHFTLEGIAPGVYFVEATFSNGTAIKKVVKL